MADLKIRGKVAIVTGGASGIGEAISLSLGKEGAKVVVADLNEENAKKTVKKIQSFGGEAYPAKVDVSNRNMVKNLFESIVNKYERVDILVTAAAINEGGKVEDVSQDSWERVISVNLTGTFFCIQEAVRIMKKQGGKGKIVTIASDTAKRGGGRSGGGGSQYASSKGGVLVLTKTIAREMGSYSDFYINCVCPGPTDTPMHKNQTEEQHQAIIKEIPKGRFAKPEEIANAVLFLVSELSTFVYGASLNVDGGLIRE